MSGAGQERLPQQAPPSTSRAGRSKAKRAVFCSPASRLQQPPALPDLVPPPRADSIINPEAPLALRLSGQLLLGIVRVYLRKLEYLSKDAQSAVDNLNKVRVCGWEARGWGAGGSEARAECIARWPRRSGHRQLQRWALPWVVVTTPQPAAWPLANPRAERRPGRRQCGPGGGGARSIWRHHTAGYRGRHSAG